MASDEAWQHQAVAATPWPISFPANRLLEHREPLGLLQITVVWHLEKTHEELALEVEQARARMMAAKQGDVGVNRAATDID